jgi:hypothetical protein
LRFHETQHAICDGKDGGAILTLNAALVQAKISLAAQAAQQGHQPFEMSNVTILDVLCL